MPRGYLRNGVQRFVGFVCLAVVSSALSQTPAEDALHQMQHWQIQCMAKGCIASVDILRGESGDTPDPNDAHQYVSIAVGLDHGADAPSLFMFEVDPHADQGSGVDLVFANDVTVGESWNDIFRDGNLVHLPFRKCNADECMAVLGSGKPDPHEVEECRSLLPMMLSNRHLFMSYLRNGHPYRTAISLSIFSEAYNQLKQQVLRQPATGQH